ELRRRRREALEEAANTPLPADDDGNSEFHSDYHADCGSGHDSILNSIRALAEQVHHLTAAMATIQHQQDSSFASLQAVASVVRSANISFSHSNGPSPMLRSVPAVSVPAQDGVLPVSGQAGTSPT
ncbi:hypothetical protein FOL47_006188, partial [Perkinsus chesapeaki]